MSGVFGALFSGKAATETDDTMREWRKLFLQEDQLDLQRQQLEQAVTLQEDSQAHAIELTNLQDRLADENLDRQEAFEIGQQLFQSQEAGNTPLEQQYAIAEQLQQSGNRWADFYQENIRSSLLGSPQETQAAIDALFTAKPGQKFNAVQYRLVAPAYASMAGLEGEEREAFIQQVNNLVTHYNELGGDVDELGMRKLRAEVADLEETVNLTRSRVQNVDADTELKDAQTENVGASTARILRDIERDDEIHPFLVRQHEAQAGIYEQQEIQEGIKTGIYPDQLAANLNETLERTESHELANDLSRATFDDAVAKFAAETDIAIEDARFAVAFSSIRLALKENELDRGEQMLELLIEQTDGQALQNQERGLTMLNTLVENGSPEAVERLGGQLLSHFPNLADEDRQEILSMATEIAGANRVTQGHLEALDVRVKEAQARREEADADLAEFKAEQAPAQVEFDNWAKREGLRLQAINANAYLRSVEGQYPERDPNAKITGADLHEDVRDDLGYSFGDIREKISEYNTALADLEMLQAGISQGVVPTDLQTKYNITDPEQLERLLQRRVDNLNQEVEGDLTGYIAQGFGLSNGYIFTPEELGLEEDDPFYRNAVMNLPWVREQVGESNERVTEVNDRVHTLINTMSGVFGPDGASLMGAASVYDILLEEFGQERLSEAGYDNPSEFRDSLTEAAQEYSANADIAETAMEQLDAFGVANVPDNFGGRQTAQQVYRSFIHGANAVREQLMQWNSGGMFGMGRDTQTSAQLASSILSLAPEGSYTTLVDRNVITPAGNGIGDGDAALAYLDDYIGNLNTNINALQFMNLRNPE